MESKRATQSYELLYLGPSLHANQEGANAGANELLALGEGPRLETVEQCQLQMACHCH